MTIKTSRRFFLSSAGALAAAAFSGAASAQDVIGEILKSDRRGNWDDTFDDFERDLPTLEAALEWLAAERAVSWPDLHTPEGIV